MRKLLTAIIVSLCFAFAAKAQYVNIPDSNFRSFLIGKYPSCFNVFGQMDTLCSANLTDNIIFLDYKNIQSFEGIKFFKNLVSLSVTNNQINSIPTLPMSLKSLVLDNNELTTLSVTNSGLNYLSVSINKINKIIKLPDSLATLYCDQNLIDSIPSNLPKSLKYLSLYANKLNAIYNLSDSIERLVIDNNSISYIDKLPLNLKRLECNSCSITKLPILPNNLEFLYCINNKIDSLPTLPNNLKSLVCYKNKIKYIPNIPDSLQSLLISSNFIKQLPKLNSNLKDLRCNDNPNLYCLPSLPKTLVKIYIDTNNISCLPNLPTNCSVNYPPISFPICTPINNVNHCQSFPIIQTFAYTDNNSNNKQNINEYPKHNLKLTLSNNNCTYTKNNGTAYINADSLGTYTITATPPNFYSVVPPSITHTFSSYDTLVMDTFALQPIMLKDSIGIKLTPTNWAARAGRPYPYLVSYENVGTTVLSNAVVSLHYNNSLLNYDSSSVASVANNGSSLSLNIGNVVPGQTGNFFACFTVKTTAVLNSSFTSIAAITTNTVGATDSVQSIVRGSYDPNDKQATPSLTLQDVSDGKNIDYTIRFQNTGTDTAFNVVIADTLDSKLLGNQVQMVGSSHPCRTTVKDNIIFFEFLDIMLPDSNVNKFGSNGFVSFKIKPVATVAVGTIIPNKAAIYFDYNSPVITKPANTIIQNPLPLQLLSFSAIPQNEVGKILVYWNTENEVNTAYFIIETSSNGINFKAAAEVAAKGIGNNSYFYSIDKATVVYVRLKMVDKDGRFTYSNIIKIASMVELFDGLMVVKNPTKNQLQLKVISNKLNNTNASLVNAQGKVAKRFILQQGYQVIDISGFAAGVYYLQSNEGSKKVVVE